ncbi:MAG: response regulator transcription factor [Anaerolineae bacterium]|nr:response regulator transcription factor [Anaerolineae bacterium]
MTPARILIIDDELSIRLTLAEILTNDGYEVTTAENGQAALEIITHQSFDLALIDINLGDMKGTEVLSAMREQSIDTVAIILTAHASLNTAIDALRGGAYDYLFKPCQADALREVIKKGLVKRHHSVRQQNLLYQLEQNLSSTLNEIRSTVSGGHAKASSARLDAQGDGLLPLQQRNESQNTLQKGGLAIDFDRHLVTIAGNPLELSPTEFGVFAYLVTASPRAVSPQELVSAVQGYESDPVEASDLIRAHIYHIRRKIKQTTGQTNIIRTVRNSGYQIE